MVFEGPLWAQDDQYFHGGGRLFIADPHSASAYSSAFRLSGGLRLYPTGGYWHTVSTNGLSQYLALTADECRRLGLDFRMQNCPGCWQDWVPLSISCAETEAAEWRLTIGTKRAYDLKYVRLSSAARLDNWQGLAGWTLRGVAKSGNTGQQKATWVDAGKILDVSANMKPDGSFSAILPAGEWTILRFGHVNMGTRNAPAPEEATGWKCDRRIPL